LRVTLPFLKKPKCGQLLDAAALNLFRKSLGIYLHIITCRVLVGKGDSGTSDTTESGTVEMIRKLLG
jgi:hypothetical protein